MKLNLAWFIGFAPANDPKVAIATLVEGVIPQVRFRRTDRSPDCQRHPNCLFVKV